MSRPSLTCRLTSIVAVALVALPLVVPGVRAAEPETLVISQVPPELTYVDLTGDGWGPGDLFTFRADVVTADGRAGTLAGDHETISMPATGPFQEHRVGIAVFDLGGGDTILFGGQTSVASKHEMITPGVSLARAVLGGTGAYAGAHGEVVSVRAEDGSWTHTLTFETTDPAAPTTDIVVEASDPVSHDLKLTSEPGMARGDARTWHFAGTTADGEPVSMFGAHYRVLGEGEQGPGSEVVGIAVLRDANGDLLLAAGRNPIGPADDPYPPVGVTIEQIGRAHV